MVILKTQTLSSLARYGQGNQTMATDTNRSLFHIIRLTDGHWTRTYPTRFTKASKNDGIDNDEDGAVDREDFDCRDEGQSPEPDIPLLAGMVL